MEELAVEQAAPLMYTAKHSLDSETESVSFSFEG